MEPLPSFSSIYAGDNLIPEPVRNTEAQTEEPEVIIIDDSTPTQASIASPKRTRESSLDMSDERPRKSPYSFFSSGSLRAEFLLQPVDIEKSQTEEPGMAIIDASTPTHASSVPPERTIVSPLDSSEDEWPRKSAVDGLRRFIVHPKTIQVSFDDIHVHSNTIEALGNLTLALDYPDAFSYGILSKGAPPSVLLYGPPGTGKTQLVRALAKQARSKILAISSADIHDKYVGVGEKMIKDLFKLAKREHPCIIFIDEADCLFRSRSSESNKNYQSYLNEFLVAMDGIGSRGARSPTIVAATNRPFDIDEGILRRLGRRIMVGMPDAAAREEILKIHVRGESLAPDVSLSDLAKVTPNYSGSDLKNLVYSAALRALREEADQPQAQNLASGAPAVDDSSGSAERCKIGCGRVLRKEHFAYAKRETHPSPVADTVAKIQEFHNKHGDTVQRSGASGPVNKSKAPVSC
ncbi:mitochondrial ATPase, aaa-type [Grosmannia clavigera kw1407]|uniref:Mitochondrial ATPase, aaa-type n=1 Tax=Grosmannia clavigera (strain kw1407 / UAMH 11150) TaxID=655863 RepID=F0X6M5_GROCL|nr:mitochondrial ATPase, aaa-type [Grosmannia clavigera kw1407]EFX06609.1 mitochondrial ATPase, aaa-type [Grosmannia clavigera kw1407]